MVNRRSAYIFSGAILCLGNLACADEIRIVGTAVAASTFLKLAVIESGATGPPQLLGPRASKPTPRAGRTSPVIGFELERAVSQCTIKSVDATLEMPSIISIQRALSRLGYDPGPVDGQIGPRTKGAIVAYEKEKGLSSTGTVRPRLYQRLFIDLNPSLCASPVSVRNEYDQVFPVNSRSQAIMDSSTGDRVNAHHPTAIDLHSPAESVQGQEQTAAAEPRSSFELAIADFLNAVRAIAHFAVRLAIGPRSRKPGTMKVESVIDGPGKPNAGNSD